MPERALAGRCAYPVTVRWRAGWANKQQRLVFLNWCRMKTKVVFLSSGKGANLALALAFAKSPKSKFEVVLVLSDRECGALEIARNQGVQCNVFEPPLLFQNLKNFLDSSGADVVVTTIHKILPAWLINQFAQRFVNLHYSLLPNLAGTIGANTLRQSYGQGSIFAGPTVHFVSNELDGGEQLAQVVIPKNIFPSFESFSSAVTLAGGLALMYILSNWSFQSRGQHGAEFSYRGANLRFPAWSNIHLPTPDKKVLSEFLSIYGEKSMWPEMLEGSAENTGMRNT